MADTLKVLGQAAPAAATDTDLYTVPANTQTAVSLLVAANRGLVAVLRIAVRPAGAAIANQHYVAYDFSLAAGGRAEILKGVTLEATDVVTVRSDTADVSFSLFGVEQS